MHNFINPHNIDIYHQRWQKLLELFPDNIVIIISSGENIHRNSDVEYPFRANSNFFYLTGFTEANATLCLIKKNTQISSLIFTLPKNEAQETWHGIRCGYENAQKILQTNASYSIDDINDIMPLMLAQVEYACIDFSALYNEHTLLKDILFNWLSNIQSFQRMGHISAQNIINLQPSINQLRLIKDNYEQNIMRKASKISALGHINTMKKVKDGIAEYNLEAELLHTFIHHGGQNVAYNSIVATGANSCILHHRAGKSILKDGDLCLIDAACEFDGYASDITRTFPVNGIFNYEQSQVYTCVLNAQNAAINHAKSGVSFDSIHEVALTVLVQGMLDIGLIDKNKYSNVEQVIEAKAYQQFYMHRTSHWLGLDVHDVGMYKKNIDKQNNINLKFDTSKNLQINMQTLAYKKSSIILQEGMCLTIEPAIYIKPHADINSKYWNIGIRIEDDIIIQKDNCEILTRDVPVEIKEIEYIIKHK